MKVCISYPVGCPRSMLDAAQLIEYCKHNNWELIDKIEDADVVAISSCGFNQEQENLSFNFLSLAYRKKKKNAIFITYGCLTGINRQRLTKTFPLIPLSRWDWGCLDEKLDATVKIAAIPIPNDLSIYSDYLTNTFSDKEYSLANRLKNHPLLFHTFISWFTPVSIRLKPSTSKPEARKIHYSKQDGRSIFNLRISSGCLEECSFCAIRKAMGRLKSISADKILEDFNRGLAEGYSVFRLVAEDVGAYGQDIDSSIADLLKKILERKGDFNLLIDDFHPRWLIKYLSELEPLLVCHPDRFIHLGLPIQSGSNRMLRLMNRDYKIEDVLKAIKAIRAKAPSFVFHTHIIIGFPGETEEDMQRTVDVLKEIHCQKVIYYEYGDRPNTEASQLLGKIAPKVIIERAQKVEEILKFTDNYKN